MVFLSFISSDIASDIIYEGKSVGKIEIGMTVFQVDSILKSEPKKIIWTNHSYEYRYNKQGISVYELQNDSTHTIFAITVYPNKWRGKTNKGLRINKKLKIKDVIDIYGSPEWSYTTDCSELDAEYEYIGVYFSVDTIGGICDETEINHDSLFYNNKVIELTIGKEGTDY